TAYVMVVDHPYAAVTDASGAYRIAGMPPGTYRLRFWHERLGVREEPVVIRSGGETIVNLAWRTDGSRPWLTNPEERAP
ncbi:MAG: carboxypeptidase-like regulatory domain-containing protein, partial [candidate division NC10 bacterium]